MNILDPPCAQLLVKQNLIKIRLYTWKCEAERVQVLVCEEMTFCRQTRTQSCPDDGTGTRLDMKRNCKKHFGVCDLCHERRLIVADSVDAGLMHFEDV